MRYPQLENAGINRGEIDGFNLNSYNNLAQTPLNYAGVCQGQLRRGRADEGFSLVAGFAPQTMTWDCCGGSTTEKTIPEIVNCVPLGRPQLLNPSDWHGNISKRYYPKIPASGVGVMSWSFSPTGPNPVYRVLNGRLFLGSKPRPCVAFVSIRMGFRTT